MNAAIRAVVRAGIYNECKVYGVYQGFEGLIAGQIQEMSLGSVADIIHRGGTILRTSRSRAFMTPEGRVKAKENLDQAGIENIVVIGGNGSLQGALELSRLGISTIGIPATIDNDVVYTRSIGFDSAVNTALDAINRIRDTASSHGRVFIIQVMGRRCGELALFAGVAGGAESILIPEIEPDFDQISRKIENGLKRGKLHSILVAAEGAYPVMELKTIIEEKTGQDTRVTILGHVQRGGTPTAVDRIMASCMGKAAVDCILDGRVNMMISGIEEKTHAIPLGEVVKGTHTPELNILEIARILSI